ncbi:Protein of unknown function [Butyrivibrio hungatei DSM 14810]|uniref:DUF2806 domain-containing protein n=1 Tax=Butyrivibrio hungatei DSM 14810 TaxID=1121132 RepID=A0A1M7SDU4_9FIRM|nr:DUF2806 domain-containing protein [Butyrivibrio hungatei]SHN56658.1 Protein of unknown function [Butyrivibrio hungatei DSM 14810]
MAGDNYSLFNFDGASDVVNNLINKLASATGWIVNHDTAHRIAQKTFIKDIQNSDIDPVSKALLISQSGKIIRERTNQHNTLSIAINSITKADKIEDVDNDWIVQFMESVKNISDVEFQKVWALIFASECSKPGSVPKSLLFVLQRMDKNDAELFVRFSSLVVKVCGVPAPCLFDEFYESGKEKRGIYETSGMTYEDLTQLEALGLVKTSAVYAGGFFIQIDEKS